jgi:Na+/melibiose symporter-like transporter
VSLVTETTARPAERFRVTRSRRNVVWTGAGALIVVVVLALFPCIVLQQTLASYNAWYLIILGLVAIFMALFARRGLWRLVDARLNLRLFPVGYWLRLDK